MSYRHTQIGWVTLIVLGAVAAVAATVTASAPGPGPSILVLILVILFLLFPTLSTRVEGRSLTVAFGPGVIRRTIDLADVREVRVVRNSWLSGWGIRWIGTGWMWNVSGLEAVELEYTDGGRFRIGTDEPEKLAAAVRVGIGRR